jgi:hypothetical protein
MRCRVGWRVFAQDPGATFSVIQIWQPMVEPEMLEAELRREEAGV